MSETKFKIDKSWSKKLDGQLRAEYFSGLWKFLETEKKSYTVYPVEEQIFAAFNAVAFEKVKVIILGQDPYHGPGQANGLSFSVNKGIKIPPSLKNIFKEIKSDVGGAMPEHGDLTGWSHQGVFLLNATLTVREKQPRSHQNKGWEIFTDHVIKTLSDKREGLIFLLWGRYAGMKENIIDASRHYILKAAHPSPFSAHRGFFGCKHFSKTNEILKRLGRSTIDWSLSEKIYE